MKRTIKAMLISASLLGLGIIGTGSVHSVNPVSTPVHASRVSYNTQLTRRVDRFANQRQKYYYPEITYNTRDLGGMKTMNGKYEIKPGMLYRSANLHKVNQVGAQELGRLNIHHDIDLRAWRGPNSSISQKPQPGEDRAMHDKYRIHMHYHNYPVETSAQERYTWPIRKRLGETYRFGYWYTTNPSARRAYRNSIKYMIRQRGPVMFNCTQGRDRTGVLSAIVESMLGISKRNIYNDFLLTNHYIYQSSYTDQISRINRFYRTMHHAYGPTWRYIHKGLGLSNHDVNAFRHKFLKRI